MSAPSASRVAVLVGFIAAISVASAGCIVQDRPHEVAYSIVADAGHDQVLPVGSTAHFEWDEHHAVQSDSEHPPEVELEYSWHSSDAAEAISHTNSSTVTRSTVGFTTVGLEVEGDGVIATDAAGALFIPPDVDTTRMAYIAVLGEISLADEPGFSSLVHEVELEGHPAQWIEIPLGPGRLTAAVWLNFSDVALATGGEIPGSLVVAIKRGAGPAVEATTGPVLFDGANGYRVMIPVGAGSPYLWVTGPGEHTPRNITFGELAQESPGEGEMAILVTESQSLPGFEGAAVAISLGAVALLVTRRRR